MRGVGSSNLPVPTIKINKLQNLFPVTNPYAAQGLQRRIEAEPPSWLSLLNPVYGGTSADSFFKVVGGLGPVCSVFGVIASTVTRQIPPDSWTGLVFDMIGYGRDVGEKTNILPVRDYAGLKSPIVLAYDRTNPKYKEIVEMGDRLKQYMRRKQ